MNAGGRVVWGWVLDARRANRMARRHPSVRRFWICERAYCMQQARIARCRAVNAAELERAIQERVREARQCHTGYLRLLQRPWYAGWEVVADLVVRRRECTMRKAWRLKAKLLAMRLRGECGTTLGCGA